VHGADSVGHATHMLSYAWGYRICDILDALTAWSGKQKLDPKRVYMWMCCVCVNQHRVKERQARQEVVPFDEFRRVFEGRVRAIKKIVALMMPWDRPTYLTRSWCMYEMHTAIKLGKEQCELEVCMPPKEEDLFIDSVLRSREGIQDIWRTIQDISIERAEATSKEDERGILQLVGEEVGKDEFEKEVKKYVQQWFLYVASKHLACLPFKFLVECFKLGRLYSDLGINKTAISIFDYCWEHQAALQSTPFRHAEDASMASLGAGPKEIADRLSKVCHQLGGAQAPRCGHGPGEVPGRHRAHARRRCFRHGPREVPRRHAAQSGRG